MIAYDYDSIEQKLRELIMSLHTFTDAQRTEVLQFVDAGEYGLALETAFDITIEEGKKISDESRHRFAELAAEMKITDSVDVAKL